MEIRFDLAKHLALGLMSNLLNGGCKDIEGRSESVPKVLIESILGDGKESKSKKSSEDMIRGPVDVVLQKEASLGVENCDLVFIVIVNFDNGIRISHRRG